MFRGREFPRIHDRPSILSFIRGALDISGCLPDPACALPDEKPLAPGELGWMAGAFDGVLSHHMGGTVDPHETAPRLAQAIVDASAKPRRRQLAALVDRASRLLDLAATASGPSTAIGIGPEFKPHAALGWMLQGLREHPGLGADIISAAMVSPSIQNRNGALNLLEATPAQSRSGEHRQQLEYMAAADPDDKVRQRAADLLAIGEAH